MESIKSGLYGEVYSTDFSFISAELSLNTEPRIDEN